MTTAADLPAKTARRAVKKAIEALVEVEETTPAEVVEHLDAELLEKAGPNLIKIGVAAGVFAVGIAGLLIAYKKFYKKTEPADEYEADLDS